MNLHNLDVFRLSHRLALKVYGITQGFPDSEKYGLTSQIRRASSSICMNLAEGSSRLGSKEFRRFVSIARGSCGEMKYQVVLSRDLGYIGKEESEELEDMCVRISKMLMKLYKSL